MIGLATQPFREIISRFFSRTSSRVWYLWSVKRWLLDRAGAQVDALVAIGIASAGIHLGLSPLVLAIVLVVTLVLVTLLPDLEKKLVLKQSF